MLNLADGLFSEMYNYKIICTLSASAQQINSNILKKSKTVLRYEFNELNKLKTRKLRSKLGDDKIINTELVLSDIYNNKKNI